MNDLLKNSHDNTNFTLKEAINEAKRCLNCLKPICRTGCPIENEIPAFIKELANGNIGQASAVIARHSNLPAVCGRVCAHEKQCEGSCILSKKGEGIKIGKLERFIADLDADLEITPLPKSSSKKGNVAIIGSGPAGLTVAGDLAKLGFEITVFDAQAEPGGVLMYGIPAFRLCKDVVRREIQRIERLGVTFKNSLMVGRDISLDQLFNQGFDAIFIGTGNSIARRLDIDGSNLAGILQAKYLLQIVALANQHSVGQEEIPIVKGDNVIVIGAGNVAMDVARTALRSGARKVTVYARSRHISAIDDEVELTELDGAEIVRGKAICAIDDNGPVFETAIFDEDNNVVGYEEELDHASADTVVIAASQVPKDKLVLTTGGLETDHRGLLSVDERGMTTVPGVFAAGDVVNGPLTVVHAVAGAKLAVEGMTSYLGL